MTILSQEFVFTAIDAEKAGEKFPINFNDVWEKLGYTRKADAKRALMNYLILDEDFVIDNALKRNLTTTGFTSVSEKGALSTMQNIKLTIDAFKMFCMMAQTTKGREVRKYFIEVEKEYRKSLERQFEASPNDLVERLEKAAKYKALYKQTLGELNQVKSNAENLKSQNSIIVKQVSELTESLQKSKDNQHKLKLQRDNYYDQLQTLKSANILDLEEKSNESEFPRSFATLYSHVGYKTKKYLFFNVMLDLLKLKENVDYKFDGANYTKGKVNYSNLSLTESAFQAILAFGRPASGLLISSETPRKLGISRSFLVKHNTSKESTNTLQPKTN